MYLQCVQVTVPNSPKTLVRSHNSFDIVYQYYFDIFWYALIYHMPAFNSHLWYPNHFISPIFPQLQTSQGAQWVPRFRKHHQNELSSNTNGHKLSQVWTTDDTLSHQTGNYFGKLLLKLFCCWLVSSAFPNMRTGSNSFNASPLMFSRSECLIPS